MRWNSYPNLPAIWGVILVVVIPDTAKPSISKLYAPAFLASASNALRRFLRASGWRISSLVTGALNLAHPVILTLYILDFEPTTSRDTMTRLTAITSPGGSLLPRGFVGSSSEKSGEIFSSRFFAPAVGSSTGSLGVLPPPLLPFDVPLFALTVVARSSASSYSFIGLGGFWASILPTTSGGFAPPEAPWMSSRARCPRGTSSLVLPSLFNSFTIARASEPVSSPAATSRFSLRALLNAARSE